MKEQHQLTIIEKIKSLINEFESQDIQFITTDDLEFLFESIESLVNPHYYDNHYDKFIEITEKYDLEGYKS